MFQVGERVDDYEIVAKLRAGGMATLFLARRRGASGFSKHVAIKVVHEHLAADAQFVGMFVDEALLSARVQHPNVVHVEELKQKGNRHYLVMEYVNGCSLSQLLRRLAVRRRRPAPELATYIAIQVADGLHAAHELKAADGTLEGLVHRDVSPQNILFAWEGHVKLIDFGVAKAQSRVQQTAGASFKGKIRYMSPEQASGKLIDRRTDVYALGIVLWELLTMKRRFKADNDFALLDLVRAAEPIAPSTLNPDVPPALDAVVMKAVAIDPADRYATAQELRRELAKAVPRALALDASHLADLLTAVGDKDTVSDSEPEALQTMTMSATSVGAFLESKSEFDVDVGELMATPEGSPATLPTVAPRRSKRMAWVAAAALTLAVGVGVGVLLLNDEPVPVVVPLAPPMAAPAALPDADALLPEAEAEAEAEAPEPPTARAQAEAEAEAEAEADAEERLAAERDAMRRARRVSPTMMSTRMSPRMSTMSGPVLADDFGF